MVPEKNCSLCPRLAAFREQNAKAYPHYFNGSVPAFGTLDARILVIGLAPGLKGANQTGRPFTGDFAGDILYQALAECGFASGVYDRRSDDGFVLKDVRITNAVRCVPPQNKPQPSEIRQCNGFLASEILAMPRLQHLLCLGRVSHEATVKALGIKLSNYKFAHGNKHAVIVNERKVSLWNSFHTSRYNMQTRRLTCDKFLAVLKNMQSEVEN